MQQFLYYTYFNNTVANYLLFLGVVLVSFVVIRVTGFIVTRHLFDWARKTKTTVDDLFVGGIQKYLTPIGYFAAFYLSTKILYLNEFLTKTVNTLVLAFITIIGAMFASSLVVFLVNRFLDSKMSDANNREALQWISRIGKGIIWIIALILFLDNINVKINSLITGLGIGGIAIAFAAQAILADVFCFFTIFFDRPFEIGDFITTGDQMGTVERIGVKTTRLRALDGEQLIFSNTDLTNSRISNYKTMQQRRVLFTLGVTYDTPYDKLKEIPCLIKQIVENVPGACFGRAHFYSYGAYSLNFEIAYYVLSNDYNRYMDTNQEVNYRIKEEFEKRGIVFAFPTQTLHLFSSPSSPDGKTY